MSRVPFICVIGAACSVGLASVGRWCFPSHVVKPACSTCSEKFAAGGLSSAGVGAIRFFKGLDRQRFVTPQEAVLLRMWMSPRTDWAIRFDPVSAAPEHEFLMVRGLAVSTAARLVAAGRWQDESDRANVWCALDRLAAENDDPSLGRTIVAALAVLAHSDSAYNARATNTLARYLSDPDPAIQAAAVHALSALPAGGLHTR